MSEVNNFKTKVLVHSIANVRIFIWDVLHKFIRARVLLLNYSFFKCFIFRTKIRLEEALCHSIANALVYTGDISS